jgi:hypothetical protein
VWWAEVVRRIGLEALERLDGAGGSKNVCNSLVLLPYLVRRLLPRLDYSYVM